MSLLKNRPRMIAGLTDTDQAWSATQTGTRWALTGGTAYLGLSSSNLVLNYAPNDYTSYVSDVLTDVINSVTVRTLSATQMTLGGNFLPITTETHNLGSASFEWNNVYSQNAVTVSDMRRKEDIGLIDGQQALDFIEALEPRLFRFKNTVVPARSETVLVEAIDGDGERHLVSKTIVHPEMTVPHKRPHSGFFAQQVKEAMTQAGIEDCGVYAYDPETDTHELRLFEMVAWLTAGVKELMARGPAPAIVEDDPPPPEPDPRDEELAALRERVAELEQQAAAVNQPAPAPVIQEPERLRDDLLDFDADASADLTGDMLLNAFEQDEAETAAVVQTLSATRLRHLSEQLNVERARLDREHQLTGFANPRAASIDRLIGLLTRRGEV